MKLDKRILVCLLIVGIVAIGVGVARINSLGCGKVEEYVPRYTEEAVIGIAKNYLESQGKDTGQYYKRVGYYSGNGLWKVLFCHMVVPDTYLGQKSAEEQGNCLIVYVDERTGAVH